MTNMIVTQRVGVGQVELEDLKLANLARRKQRLIESKYEQIIHKTCTSSIWYYLIELHSLQNRRISAAERGLRPRARSAS